MSVDITIALSKVTRWLAIAAAVLLLANCADIAWLWLQQGEGIPAVARLFILGFENNIPTWFSSVLLLLAAVLLALVAEAVRANRGPFLRHWRVLAVLFVALSIDETASMHEMLDALGQVFEARGLLHFAWVLPGMLLVTVLVLAYWPFLLHLRARTRRRFIVAGCLYIGGAIGFEMIGGWWYERSGPYNLTYGLLTTIEEMLEIVGLLVFLDGLARALAEREVRVALTHRQTSPSDP